MRSDETLLLDMLLAAQNDIGDLIEDAVGEPLIFSPLPFGVGEGCQFANNIIEQLTPLVPPDAG